MAAMATLVPLMILLSRSREARATYPLIRAARWSLGLLAANAVSWAYLLAGYELCVRGFLLLALARAAGDAAAIAMATVVYSAVHLPRGAAETLLHTHRIGVRVADAGPERSGRPGSVICLIACTTEAACCCARRDLAPAGASAARAAAPESMTVPRSVMNLLYETVPAARAADAIASASSPDTVQPGRPAATWPDGVKARTPHPGRLGRPASRGSWPTGARSDR
jgi:hypothetical protein